MNIYTSETEYLKTEVQRLSALVRAQQITIDKLEQALAAPVQEPVAYIEHHTGGDNLVWDDPGGKRSPLYTTPPAQPAPVPLTDEQIDAIRFSIPTKAVTQRDFELARAIEAKLKEKNT